jgi:hypothetical protein
MGDPDKTTGLSITLKQEGRDGMWMVFHGLPHNIREDIIVTFGLDGAKYADYTLHDLALEAQRLYRGMGNVSTILGGQSVPDVHKGSTEAKAAADAKEENPLLALIEACESVAELQALYKRNVDEFKGNGELLSAWKGKGKSLAGAK